jgi:hypothetical protein
MRLMTGRIVAIAGAIWMYTGCAKLREPLGLCPSQVPCALVCSGTAQVRVPPGCYSILCICTLDGGVNSGTK